MIETEHLVIRRFREEDLMCAHHFLSEPAVMAYSGLDPFSSEQSKEWLQHHLTSDPKAGSPGVFAIEQSSSKEVIGYCGLEKLPSYIADEMEVTVGLIPGHWGKGYGIESVSALVAYGFANCRLERVVAVVHTDNLRAQRLFRICGFKRQRQLTVAGAGPHILFALGPPDQSLPAAGRSPTRP